MPLEIEMRKEGGFMQCFFQRALHAPYLNSCLFQLISSKSVPAKNCREGRSRFLKKDSAARVRENLQYNFNRVKYTWRDQYGELPIYKWPKVIWIFKTDISKAEICYYQSGSGKVKRPTESEESPQNGRKIEQGLFLGDNNVIIVGIKYWLLLK